MNSKNVISRLNKQKNNNFFILRGKVGTGKTNMALKYSVHLKNNFCMYDDEKVLIVTKDSKEKIKTIVDGFDKDKNIFTLFSLISSEIDIFNVNDLFRNISREIDIEKLYIENNALIKKLDKGKEILKDEYPLIVKYEEKFLLEEIQYIKKVGITDVEEYQNVDRSGRGVALKKNSKIRLAIFKLYSWYNKELNLKGLVDCVDRVNSIKKYIANTNYKYTHIIVDDIEELTIEELETIRVLLSLKTYSKFVLINNVGFDKKHNKALNGNKNLKAMKAFEKGKYKTINFKETLDKNINIMKPISKDKNFINKFTYVDLKYGIKHEFGVDSSSRGEIILEPKEQGQSVQESDTRTIPVFSSIAAGEPISMNEGIEDYFTMPNYWLKNVKEPFILTVKGDSMVNAGIDDGDLVVIRKQNVANHNEIIAVNINGEATLKRLWLKKNKAVLIPENPKYEPIEIKEEGVSILGLAVGLIKRN